MIVFPETDVRKAKKVCEVLREKVEKTVFVGAEKLPSHSLTISIGVAGLVRGKGTRNKWQLIGHADEKLYEAKGAGGNLVKV